MLVSQALLSWVRAGTEHHGHHQAAPAPHGPPGSLIKHFAATMTFGACGISICCRKLLPETAANPINRLINLPRASSAAQSLRTAPRPPRARPGAGTCLGSSGCPTRLLPSPPVAPLGCPHWDQPQSPSWGTLRGAGPAPPVRKPCTTLGARCPPALAPGSSAADWSSEVPWDTILSGKLGIKRPIILGRLAAAEQWKTNYCIPSPVVAPGFTQPLVQGDLGEKAAPKRNPQPKELSAGAAQPLEEAL